MNIYAKIAVLPLAILMAACQNQETPVVEMPADGAQVINITVSHAKSRAGRPLQSTEAGQSIENVKILLVDDANKVVWTKTLNRWNTIDATVVEGGRETTIEIPKDEYRMVAGKVYRAYAVGYSDGSDYDLSQLTGLKANDTFAGDLKIKTKNGSAVAEEIFAGDCVSVGNLDGVRINLVLTRQVAGTYGYMTRIPYVTDKWGNVGTYLILCATNAQDEMMLGQFDNGDAKYVAGGTHAATSQVIYSIDLRDWFGVLAEQKDASNHGNGLIIVDNNWRGDNTRFRKGSVFAGEFIMPFVKTEGASMRLYLCTTNDITTAVRTWDVLLPADAVQYGSYTLWSPGVEGWTSTAVTDDTRCYSVLRNHLYGIGVKNSVSLPGYDPENPDAPIDPDEDNPEPINNKQEVPITVNHNWDVIYNMEVE